MRHPRRYKNGVPIDDEPVAVEQDESLAEEREAERHVAELDEQLQRLSLPALSDPKIAAEYADVRSMRAAAVDLIEQKRLARAEEARLAAEARAQASAEARAQAMAEAQRLQVEREQAARAFDSHARKMACALADYARICGGQERALSAAGRRGGPAAASAVERAVAYALSSGGVQRGVIELPPLSGRPAPLSELDPRHVEAANEAEDVTGETELHKGVDTNG